ncbi:integrase core domain-containing protein [Fibrobacter sp. HC4]|uniref:integrase core domain-containing protein n=1 Tax=Fibrobacter sp. HC4 TaxID=3239812 RepID=UPI002018D037|nr:integrase core domain-containing protein [Fibrobacter succinogenes]MCL4102413.1 putative transposase InsK for insertion sequence element IS150 [Fibrobacter succinogenes]
MYAENLLQRNFAPFGLNQYWCGDITYIRTNLGWVYLAVVNRGTQYSSRGYRNLLNDFGIEPSMSAPGSPYDNAAMESLFASLKKQQVHHRSYADIDEVREDLFKYIELFYNRKRLHSSLGYMSPIAYRLQKLCA